MNYELLVKNILKRYQGMSEEAFRAILCPTLIPIKKIVNNVFLMPGQQHWRASFQIEIKEEYADLITETREGIFVPSSYALGEGEWKNLAKGRIINVDSENHTAYGEILFGNTKEELEEALQRLSEEDYFEIEEYGISEKITASLIEYNLAELAKKEGYTVTKLPNMRGKAADSPDEYPFEFTKDGVTKRIQVKSLWAQDTRYARLIHPKSNRYLTSSCKFDAQDIFAVSLYPRTGNTMDFAFAKSISKTQDPLHGLEEARGFAGFVTQNPECEIDQVVWFDTLDGVWSI